MTWDTILRVTSLVSGGAAFICCLAGIFRRQQRRSAGLHPLVFCGLVFLLAAIIADVFRHSTSAHLWRDAISCSALLFVLAGCYVRTSYRTWKPTQANDGGSPSPHQAMQRTADRPNI